MYIFTESGHSINTRYITSISWCDFVEDGVRFLVKATGSKDEVYYLDRFVHHWAAIEYIKELTKVINITGSSELSEIYVEQLHKTDQERSEV